LKFRYFFVALLEMIVGDAGPDMMDVMKADVARSPLEQLRQLIIGSSLHGNPPRIPVVVPCPIYPFELVLVVEQPYAESCGQYQHRQLHQEVGLESDGHADGHDDGGKCQVKITLMKSIFFAPGDG